MDIWFGWLELYINDKGMPVDYETDWKASCFILFTHVVWVGEVKPVC